MAARFEISQGVYEQRVSFVNEFEARPVRALLGLDLRIPRTRVFVRMAGATDGSDTRAGVSISYGWLRGR